MSDAPDPDAAAFTAALESYRQAVEAGRLADAEEALGEVLALLASHPPPPGPWDASEEHAARLEAACDWAAALAARRDLCARTAAAEPVDRHGALLGLARLLALLDQPAAALAEALAAADIARGMDIPVLLVTGPLPAVGRLALRAGCPDRALAAAEEMLRLADPSPLHDLSRSLARVLRADCSLRADHLPDAADDLDAARPALEQASRIPFAAGAHGMMGTWWSVTGRLRAAHEDFEGAAAAQAEAVERSRHILKLPQAQGPFAKNALARDLHDLGRARLAAGDFPAARAAFAESRSLRAALRRPAFAPDDPAG